MSDAITVLSSLPKAVVEAAGAHGVDPSALMRAAAVDESILESTLTRVPDDTMRRLWTRVVELSGDPCFGLEVSRFPHTTSFHSLGFGWLASPTLLEFLRRLVRYERVLIDTEWARLVPGNGRTALAIEPGLEEPVASCRVDTGFGIMVRWCRELSASACSPAAVEFRHPDHGQRERYAAVFGDVVRFDQSHNRLWFDEETLARSLPASNPVLASEVDRITEAYLATLGDGSTAERVRRHLPDLLPEGRAELEDVASRLGTSARTLQRRLQAEGHTFRSLLDQTRHALAREFLREGSHPLVEVAFRLGFADQSSFSKAFKRWTGSNPSAYAAGAPPLAP